MLFRTALALLPTLACALPAAQIAFTSPANNGIFLPANTQSDFQVLSSERHPNHRVRTRSPKGLCDPNVEQKSGYVDTPNNRHFYFWQFDSRNDPKTDPVVLWLNGGPGCSSFCGLMQELGPCGIRGNATEPSPNPYSWTNNASIIFLDQPVGVGYSYSDKNDTGVWTAEAAAEDVFAFLTIFFETYDEKFGGRPFFIAGESYAGRYIPVFADYIVTQNQRPDAPQGAGRVNLQGVLIGNGFTNPKIQYAAYYPTVCTNVTGYGPFVSEKNCESMAAALPRCQALVQQCYDQPNNAAICLSANQYCEATQTERYYETGRNPYDMLKFGDYIEDQLITNYLNREDVRHELGVDKETNGGVKKFYSCSDQVGFRFSSTGDQSQASYPHVANMVNNGVNTLLYSGKRDFICNWYGNLAWTNALEWEGKKEYNKQTLQPWYASQYDVKKGIQSGEYKQSGKLAFAIVDNSGHFVPYDHPVESLAMFNNWVHHGRVGLYA